MVQKEMTRQATQIDGPDMPLMTESNAPPPKAPIFAAQKAAPLKPLPNNRLKLICSSASDMSNLWAAVVPVGTTFEQVMEPTYYANVAGQLRVADQIDVHADDRSYFAKLYVVEAGRTRISVSKILHVPLEAPAESAEPKPYRVRYDGPHSKWCVVRVSDDRVVKDGCETRESAEAAMRAHEQSESRKVA
jgi:hypothetical protein